MLIPASTTTAGLLRRAPLTALLGLLATLAACQQSPVATEPKIDRAQLAQLNTELAVQYMQKREYQIALDKLEKALEADPRYLDAHNTMGLLRSALGQTSEAEAAFKRALAIEADNPSVLNNYGNFLCQNGRYEDGQKTFMKAISNPLYRTPEAAYSNAGTCAMSAGDLASAETHFRAALEREPDLAPTLLQMAELSFELGRLPQAQAYLARYAANAPHTPRSLWLGVRVERALGDENAAASYALKLEKNYPDSAQTKLLLESQVR